MLVRMASTPSRTKEKEIMMGKTRKVLAIVRGRQTSSILRIISAMACLSLISSALVACASPLTMTVTSPADGATLTGSSGSVKVTGTVSDTNAVVRVNGIFADHAYGSFSQTIQLTSGTNVVTIVATAGKSTVTKQVTVTYSPPAK